MTAHPALVDADETPACPLYAVSGDDLADWSATRSEAERAWLSAVDFKARPGQWALLPGDGGAPAAGVFGVDPTLRAAHAAALPYALPEGRYRLEGSYAGSSDAAGIIAFGWGLGSYRFDRFKAGNGRVAAQLEWPAAAARAVVERDLSATFMVRDLVNAPANEMGPEELQRAAEQLAAEFDAKITVLIGEDLLTNNYPLVHAVGRASSRTPRLIDITWGDPDAPKVTVLGKGVCFDSGGLDLKSAAGMALMKKDMGGGAHALGLARMIMSAGLPVRLRVLVPAVENAVSGNAFRPHDVFRSRKGTTVEIGNTDAEGRLILADALTEAADQDPALLVDFATLTGAARVALGPDLPAMFCNDENTAGALLRSAETHDDPVWRMPLWAPYRKRLSSSVADTSSTGADRMGGAIMAALFLEQFVPARTPWVHLDVYAWNDSDTPGRPRGGEAMSMRAVFGLIEDRFGG